MTYSRLNLVEQVPSSARCTESVSAARFGEEIVNLSPHQRAPRRRLRVALGDALIAGPSHIVTWPRVSSAIAKCDALEDVVTAYDDVGTEVLEVLSERIVRYRFDDQTIVYCNRA